MAEEPQEIRKINWREVLGFTHIFNSFRLSRHMTKILIALAAVLLTWGVGSVLDMIFTPLSDVYVECRDKTKGEYRTEPDAYWCEADFGQWKENARKAAKTGLEDLATGKLCGDKLPYSKFEDATKAAKESPAKVRSQLREVYADERDKAVENAQKQYDEEIKQADKEKDAEEQQKKRREATETRDGALRTANNDYLKNLQDLEMLTRQGPFSTFVSYEAHYFRQAVDAVLRGNILTGFDTIRRAQGRGDRPEVTYSRGVEAVQEDPLGLLACLTLMASGVAWLAVAHWVYAILFFLALLVIWALAAGAIARAAALQATRDEKAGIGECVKFSLRKFVNFLASPLVPILGFLVIWLVAAAVVSALGAIPGFGGVWIGLTFGLALLAGAMMAFLLIGLAAGGLLMAPTIAVEGSDTFDACTRSYQFVMARPWRAGLYGLVAAAYGTICYLFVRFVLFLVLLMSHWIVGLFTFYTARDEVRAGATKWDLMWSGPSFASFHGGVSTVGLNAVDWVGGWMVWCWVGLVGAILIAWVVSFVISASTYIYLLLRKAEDATELDEVYIEEPAEAPAAEAAAAEAPPAEGAPPAEAARPEAPKPSEPAGGQAAPEAGKQ